jgi:hypothetical protein
MNIDIYVIKSNHLKIREKSIESNIAAMKVIMQDKYKVNVIPITSPSISEIETNLKDYDKSINLNPNENDDEDFRKLQGPFNLAQLSNLYKHKNAYDLIRKSKTTHNYIIEDDVLLLPECMNNFKELIYKLESFEYDILLTCVSNNEAGNNPLNIVLSSVYFKTLVMKSSYFITPQTANKLYEYMNVIRYNMKLTLSIFINENKSNIRAYALNKNTVFEGSKLGVFPTSVNTANFLIQNASFIKFIDYLNKLNNNNDVNMNDVLEQYNMYGKDIPDFQHILGLIYYKKNMFKEAIEILKDAVINFKNKEGYLIPQNEIINNCINMHQYYQDDIIKCFSQPGKY